MDDPWMKNTDLPFDGKRMIYGGFETLLDACNRVPRASAL
jgi:uncharacterized protein YbaA (DUF1428 family)